MMLTIGAVARATGLGIQTVRFYEREGLIDEPARTRSNYRTYDESVIERLHFIRRAQELGFTLKEIRELIGLTSDEAASCEQVNEIAASKLAVVKEKIADLIRMQNALEELIDTCNCSGPLRDCSLIRCLQANDESRAACA
jgi:MerR family transcriptional regulator, copper efflux regulator